MKYGFLTRELNAISNGLLNSRKRFKIQNRSNDPLIETLEFQDSIDTVPNQNILLNVDGIVVTALQWKDLLQLDIFLQSSFMTV